MRLGSNRPYPPVTGRANALGDAYEIELLSSGMSAIDFLDFRADTISTVTPESLEYFYGYRGVKELLRT